MPESTQKLCSRGNHGFTSHWQLDLVLVWKARRGQGEQLRLGFGRGQKRPLVTVQPQWQLKAQGWRGRVEKLSLGTMKRAYKRLLLKTQPSYSRRPNILEMPVSWDDHQGLQPQWSAACLGLEDSCVCCRGQSPWRGPENQEWIPDTGHWVIYIAGVWFFFHLTVTMP
jgi:hypothetical protein